MGIKLKNNKKKEDKFNNNHNKYIVIIIGIITTLIASIGLCLSYPQIAKNSLNYYHNPLEGNRFAQTLKQSSYYIYFKDLQDKSEETLKASDVLLSKDINQDEVKDYNDSYEMDIEDYKRRFNDSVRGWSENLSSLDNLEYYAIDKDGKVVQQKKSGRINELLNNDIDKESTDNLKGQYRFYVVINYDAKGNMTIGKTYGTKKEDVLRNIDSISIYDEYFYGYPVDVEPIKDMTFVYAVPNDLVYEDNIYYLINHAKVDSYSSASYIFINIAILFTVIVALLIPSKESKDIPILKNIIELPVEVNLLLVSLIIGFIFGIGAEVLIQSPINGEILNITGLNMDPNIKNSIIYILNVIYWAVCFGAVFIEIVAIKYILSTGVIKYINEKSLIWKLIKLIYRYTKNMVKYITDIDLKDNNTKKLIMILGINYIVVAIMCSTWFVGVFISIIYTIALFVYIKKKYSKVNEDYNKLFDITNKIAEGNLDIKSDEDLGLFNSMKHEVENIQKGFKKAVNEEVKSQRMKTELISNVSHDLKTPLTSIITYVDLLKDENLSEEKRKQYLDTLDRKSQRLQSLIEDLFEVSKATSGNINMNIEDVDVVSLMKQTLFELDDKIARSQLVMRTNLPDHKVVLPLDGQRTFRVFENLIINITKYAMNGSRVYIDILDSDDKVGIVFKNMTAEEINLDVNDIVERFVRGDESRNTEGSGLGLAIAKSFVELQSGNFEIKIDGDLFKVIISFNK